MQDYIINQTLHTKSKKEYEDKASWTKKLSYFSWSFFFKYLIVKFLKHLKNLRTFL